ncbi:MAG: hypothetical protein CO021_09350 [Deltaproteobacteria bacterium CG_4_9_14_0_2_um_filter_42_21]|nr:MAG: hypothetical protein CO021_09350 [Deltaproteobacteria bacterium CG_4_9_14_0_2_um_filter_42_21]
MEINTTMTEEKLEEGVDYYINKEGNFVFTEAYHLKRGHCCESGCKHCPYGFVKPLNPSEKKSV